MDECVQGHPALEALLGDNDRSLLRDNHHHHAHFMANVFQLNDYELMARIATWAYRAYQGRGVSAEYFPIHVDAWRRVLPERLEAEHAQALLPAYDWLFAHHEDLKAASLIETPTPSFDTVDWRLFFGHVLAGRAWEALIVAREQIRDLDDHKQFLLQVAQPAMYEIGRLWEQGRISVAQEHLASAVVRQVLAALYADIPLPASESPRVMVVCAPGEQHDLAGRLLSDYLELEGLNIRFVGASLPIADILAGLREFEARVLMLSVTMPFNLVDAGEVLKALRRDKALADVRVLVGGQAFSGRPDLWREFGADGFATDPRGAARLATQWLAEAAGLDDTASETTDTQP